MKTYSGPGFLEYVQMVRGTGEQTIETDIHGLTHAEKLETQICIVHCMKPVDLMHERLQNFRKSTSVLQEDNTWKNSASR